MRNDNTAEVFSRFITNEAFSSLFPETQGKTRQAKSAKKPVDLKNVPKQALKLIITTYNLNVLQFQSNRFVGITLTP